jgi:hypothetical protein
MISRKSVLSIARAYVAYFSYIHRDRSRNSSQKIFKNKLYDFLYENEFDIWFLDKIKKINPYTIQDLKELILHIQTGQTLLAYDVFLDENETFKLGQQLLQKLAESLILECENNPDFNNAKGILAVEQMKLDLELDGYVFRNSRLFSPDSTILDESEEEEILVNLINSVQLEDIKTIKYHLDLSAENYRESNWSDSISNSRKVLEAILSQIANRFAQVSGIKPLSLKDQKWAGKVREYLKKYDFFEEQEKEAIGKIYGFLSETGSHPYIANRDQARLMRHLFLTICQFELLRLEGILNEQK